MAEALLDYISSLQDQGIDGNSKPSIFELVEKWKTNNPDWNKRVAVIDTATPVNKPSSKERTAYLLEQLAIRECRLVNTQKEIDGIKHELSGWGRESRCWSCRSKGGGVLSLCEVGNKNYPLCCEDCREI